MGPFAQIGCWAVTVAMLTVLSACQSNPTPINTDTEPEPISILKGTPFYDDLPDSEQAWWGSVAPNVEGPERYMLNVNDFPRSLRMNEGGNIGLDGGKNEALLEPYAQTYKAVIVYGKARVNRPAIPGGSYGTLYVGEIGEIDVKRIGCDSRRLTDRERQGAIVVGSDCNYYLEQPAPEETYTGVLRIGERGASPTPDRSQYYYTLDQPERQLLIGVPPKPDLEALVDKEVSILGKVVDVNDGRGPHQVLFVGQVRP